MTSGVPPEVSAAVNTLLAGRWRRSKPSYMDVLILGYSARLLAVYLSHL